MRLNASGLLNALTQLGALQQGIKDMLHFTQNQGTPCFDAKHFTWTIGSADTIAKEATLLDLRGTARSACRLVEIFNEAKSKAGTTEKVTLNQQQAITFISCIDEISGCIRDEFDTTEVFSILPSRFQYYKKSEPLFGREIEEKFSETSQDISEAGMCLALERPTAAVFHLMRAMEGAVKKLSEELEIRADREWGKLLSDIDKKIKVMPKGKERDDWSLCHANLYHVKEVWRNTTMHPGKNYTLQQAEEVFQATKSFFSSLGNLGLSKWAFKPNKFVEWSFPLL